MPTVIHTIAIDPEEVKWEFDPQVSVLATSAFSRRMEKLFKGVNLQNKSVYLRFTFPDDEYILVSIRHDHFQAVPGLAIHHAMEEAKSKYKASLRPDLEVVPAPVELFISLYLAVPIETRWDRPEVL